MQRQVMAWAMSAFFQGLAYPCEKKEGQKKERAAASLVLQRMVCF